MAASDHQAYKNQVIDALQLIEMTRRHGCSPVTLHILRTPFLKNISVWLLLDGLILQINSYQLQGKIVM